MVTGDDLTLDLDAVRQVFLVESMEGLAEMEGALLELERDPGSTEALHLVFRQAHTIKGGAATLGLTTVADVAHAIEDLLERLRSGEQSLTSELATLLLQAVDALRDAIPAAIDGDGQQDAATQRVIARLGDASAVGLAAAHHDTDASSIGRLDAAGSSARSTRTRTLRVDSAKLDRLLDLSGEIAIARGRLRQALEGGMVDADAALSALWEADGLHQEMQEEVMRARMVPLAQVFRPLVRMMRDVSMSQGKLARLVIEGEDVEVDMTVIEHLRDPLTHMLRNAVDHGLEHPGVRQAAGKSPVGTVSVSARHERGNVVIDVHDDGVGLSRERILARATRAGLVAEGVEPSDVDAYRLIFLPGFSTAEQITDLSGRGVGMDVVRRNVEALRGTIALSSVEGQGTTITIRLPLTLAIIQGFAVGIGEEAYLVPLDAVTECLGLPEDLRGSSDPYAVLNLRGEVLPLVRLRQRLGHDGGHHRKASVLVVRDDHGAAGLVVDALHGESQAVIKPLGRMLTGTPGVSGSTILGNGRVALILDVPAILEEARADQRRRTATDAAVSHAASD